MAKFSGTKEKQNPSRGVFFCRIHLGCCKVLVKFSRVEASRMFRRFIIRLKSVTDNLNTSSSSPALLTTSVTHTLERYTNVYGCQQEGRRELKGRHSMTRQKKERIISHLLAAPVAAASQNIEVTPAYLLLNLFSFYFFFTL